MTKVQNNPVNRIDPDGMWSTPSMKERSEQYSQNSMDTGDPNKTREEYEEENRTVTVDSEGHRIAASDIEDTFDSDDYEGDTYFQSIHDLDISPNFVTNTPYSDGGQIANYSVNLTLYENLTKRWVNSKGKALGLEFTNIVSYHALRFWTNGTPIYGYNGLEPIKDHSITVGLRTKDVRGLVTKRYLSSAGSYVSEATTLEGIGRRTITQENYHELVQAVSGYNKEHNTSFQRIMRFMFYIDRNHEMKPFLPNPRFRLKRIPL